MNKDKTLLQLQNLLLEMLKAENTALTAENAVLAGKLSAGVSANQKAIKASIRFFMLAQVSAGEKHTQAADKASGVFGVSAAHVRKHHPKWELELILKTIEECPDSTSAEQLTDLLDETLLVTRKK